MPATAPQFDTWTGLLIISLVATIIGLVFLLMDYSEYPKDKAPAVRALTLPAPSGGAAPAPAQPAPPAPGAGAPTAPPAGAGQPKAGGPPSQ
jgi:hypothetical protein